MSPLLSPYSFGTGASAKQAHRGPGQRLPRRLWAIATMHNSSLANPDQFQVWVFTVTCYADLAVQRQTTEAPAQSSRRKPGTGKTMQQAGPPMRMPIRASIRMSMAAPLPRDLRRQTKRAERILPSAWLASGKSLMTIAWIAIVMQIEIRSTKR